jgi:hypothetical protein
MMPRPQFTLRALLMAMLVVAAFFAGMALQWRIDNHPLSIEAIYESDGAGGLQFEMQVRTERSAK